MSLSVGLKNGPKWGIKIVSLNPLLPLETNSADPDQTLHSAASDPSLPCLPTSQSRFYR